MLKFKQIITVTVIKIAQSELICAIFFCICEKMQIFAPEKIKR